MSKSKKKPLHKYTEDQNDWIKDHSKLKRSSLAKKFNKKFGTKVSPIAVAKRKQRMLNETVKKVSVKRMTSNMRGVNISAKEILEVIRNNQTLIGKLIEKI